MLADEVLRPLEREASGVAFDVEEIVRAVRVVASVDEFVLLKPVERGRSRREAREREGSEGNRREGRETEGNEEREGRTELRKGKEGTERGRERRERMKRREGRGSRA